MDERSTKFVPQSVSSSCAGLSPATALFFAFFSGFFDVKSACYAARADGQGVFCFAQ
jgi:hypothetical protein